jgi:Carboxypeptidase regulatory-like domain
MRTLWLIAMLLVPAAVLAQQPCNGIRIEGIITDPAGAVIPGAQVQTADGAQTTTDAGGNFVLPCVPAGSTALYVQADGFTPDTATATAQPGGIAHINLQLAIAQVQTEVRVGADTTALDTDQGAGTRTLTTEDIQQLPDDSDDLLQQLQLLTSIGGGAAAATVVVDGFQNGSAMPPKSAIASIRVNPDPISPEYERPNMDGGRIEITTKPGASSLHGALFFTDSDNIFNANDPFSVTATPAGKQRYGFELSGPVIAKKSGFSLALEKRNIDEFNVANAITLDANQDQVTQHATVAAPQRLWIASARGDLQVTQKDMATLSYSANVNNLGNQGVGGLTLPEAGYSSRVAEYDLRFTNTYTANANLLHETRIGYTWKRTEQTPNSTAPELQVAGYFTGGGATSQNLNNRERDLEIDDDALITHGKHEIKLGAQSLGIFVHNYDPDTFNGAYVFGGGSAPVLDANNNATAQTTTITAIEQYRRALLNLSGGTPTTYQLTSGTPLVPYAQWRLALYGVDTIKLMPRLTVTAGLRYTFQTSPSTFANFAPRLGLAWSPDKKESWTLYTRTGIFYFPVDPSDAAQVYRLNGIRQQEALVYSPDYSHPLESTPGSIQVGTMWQFPSISKLVPIPRFAQFALGIERDLPHHWHPSVWFTWYVTWRDLLTRNINAPQVDSSNGTPTDPTAALLAPRPGAPNLNVFQYQSSGRSQGNVFWAGIEQKSYKRWTLSMGLWNVNFYGNSGTPQSSYSNRGEFARPDWQSSGALAESDLKLPYKIELSTQAYWHYGTPYNITTGTDSNGDGTFNDRPSYASAQGSGIYSTPFGLMTTNAVNGDVPHNLGTMPTIVHMYSNLSRAFKLGPQDNDHPYTLTFNVRSSNLLNHTNATAVGTVVSSPTIGQPLAAEAARRVELGVRFAF